MGKKIICLDFDGVIHSYISGWLEPDFIPDPPVPGALAFIKSVLESTEYDLKIYSSRSSQVGGIRAMQVWLKHWLIKEYGWPDGAGLGNQLMKSYTYPTGTTQLITRYNYFPTEKPSAFITIDDRALTFQGTFPTFAEINNFKPWNKK